MKMKVIITEYYIRNPA